MKRSVFQQTTAVFLVLLLSVTALALASCDSNTAKEENAEKTITVEVIDNAVKSELFSITTESDTLADALIDKKLVTAEDLEDNMITTVNGITADYEKNGAYWALYGKETYLSTGVNDTKISDGDYYKIQYTTS